MSNYKFKGIQDEFLGVSLVMTTNPWDWYTGMLYYNNCLQLVGKAKDQ